MNTTLLVACQKMKEENAVIPLVLIKFNSLHVHNPKFK